LIFIALNAAGGSYSGQLSRGDTFSNVDTPSSVSAATVNGRRTRLALGGLFACIIGVQGEGGGKREMRE
jgi:hypothetical protein